MIFDDTLLDDNDESVILKLKSFNDLNRQVATFDDVDVSAREVIVQLIAKHLEDSNAIFASAILNTLRILSRDGNNIEHLYDKHVAEYILRWASLNKSSELRLEIENMAERIDALMCLRNGLCQSSNMRKFFNQDAHFALKLYLVDLLNWQKQGALDRHLYDFQNHVLKILHIVLINTEKQQHQEVRLKDIYYVTLINIIQQNLSEEHLNEVMKVLFNLICSSGSDVKDDKLDTLLVSVLHRFVTETHKGKVIQLTVNLLAVLPTKPEILCPNINEKSEDIVALKTFDEKDMTSIQIIIDEMDRKIENNDIECIITFLTVLMKYSVNCKEARRYIRLQTLPPLREYDVTRPPSDGNTLRNKLVRLMMVTDNRIRRAASELMFVLCKRSVCRMTKYAGFGPAAGFFANSGLLGQINTPKSEEDSEDSETEAYNAVESQVNPVTGYIRPENTVSPFEGMSEEQKEFEAMKLVQLMDKLMNNGMLKPGTVGEDGKPKAVSHVLELLKDVPEPPVNDIDSD